MLISGDFKIFSPMCLNPLNHFVNLGFPNLLGDLYFHISRNPVALGRTPY